MKSKFGGIIIIMSATLGGLIKDYRLQKNISQMEIAFAFGWSEPSRLSRIEQGKVANPSREFIDRLITVMKLEEDEKNQLLLTGNYLPNDNEIAKVISEVMLFLRQWPYPAVVFDFSWRIIEENDIFKKVFYLEEKRSCKYILENLFDSNFPQNKYLKGEEREQWHKYLVKLIAQYQYIQKTRTKEKWYIKHIKRMMNNDLFKELWQKAQLTKEMDIVGNFGRKSIITPGDKQRTNYYFFVLPILKDPRFQIELFMPSK